MRGLALIAALAVLTAGPALARTEPFDPFGAAGVDPKPGAQAPLDLAFRDEAGRTVTLRQLAHGKPLVLAPVQHDCPNLCGLTLEGLGQALAGQSYRAGADYAVVAFGIDPKEGPADAAGSQAHLTQDLPGGAGVHAVVGAPADVAAVTAAIGYRYAWDPRIAQYAHIAAVAVLTPDGRLARWIYGVAPKPQDLHLALTDAGQGRLGGIGEQIRLLCYHYDPETGEYTSLVWSALHWGGAATVLALALLVGLALRRRRAP